MEGRYHGGTHPSRNALGVMYAEAIALLGSLGFQVEPVSDCAFTAYYDDPANDWNYNLMMIFRKGIIRIEYSFHHTYLPIANRIEIQSATDILWILRRSPEVRQNFPKLYAQCKIS